MDTGFSGSRLGKPLDKSAQQHKADEPMDAMSSDQYMADTPIPVPSSASFSHPTNSASRLSSTAQRRPLSMSFTSTDPHSTKRQATSFFPHNPPPSSGIFSRPSIESHDSPLPRGLRRSTGLLNLDEASNGSSVSRKSSYRSSRKPQLKSSSSSSTCSSYSSSGHSSSTSIHSELSRGSTPPPSNPFLGRMSSNSQFSLNESGMPLKRANPFGMLSEPQKPHFPKQKWPFNSHSESKPKWQFSNDSAWPKWQFAQNNQTSPTSQSSSSSSPFFRQPFFSPSESTINPFQQRSPNGRKHNHATTPTQHSNLSSPTHQQPIPKIRKLNSTDSLHHSFASSSPKFTETQPFSTNPTHPLAFSFSTSPSPTPGPKENSHSHSRSGSSSFSYNNSSSRISPAPSSSSSASTSTLDATENSKPSFAFPNKPFKLNASLEADLSTVSNPEYHTPDHYKFVKPLQTAFMSTGLLSKRNRRKPFESQMAPPDTPCKKPNAPPMTPGPAQFGNKSLFGNTFNFSPRSLPNNFNGNGVNGQRREFGRGRFSMDFGSFSESLFNEPSTPTKKDTSFGDDSSTPIFSTNGLNVPQRATKQVSNASTITPSHYMSNTPTSNNSSSTSINRYTSTPQSSGSHWMDVSPSEQSFPRTPEISMHSNVSQLSLSTEPSFNRSGLHPMDDDNDIMEDAGSVMGVPKTPAKGARARHEITVPSAIMSMDKPGHQNQSGAEVVLRERFSDVQQIGSGEFSIVYAVSEKTSVRGIEPARYAVKRTKYPYGGVKSRKRRNEEVEILRELTFSRRNANDEEGREYIVNLIDAWELSGHLYIVTEYCENGNLDTFLSERGNISRLDEWRVWKILVEITLVSFIFLLFFFFIFFLLPTHTLLTFFFLRVYDSCMTKATFTST